jgi:hypothetical protein
MLNAGGITDNAKKGSRKVQSKVSKHPTSKQAIVFSSLKDLFDPVPIALDSPLPISSLFPEPPQLLALACDFLEELRFPLGAVGIAHLLPRALPLFEPGFGRFGFIHLALLQESLIGSQARVRRWEEAVFVFRDFVQAGRKSREAVHLCCVGNERACFPDFGPCVGTLEAFGPFTCQA